MKKLLLVLLLLPIFALAQEGVTNFQRANGTTLEQTCVKVDSIFVTAKVRELGNRNIKFGIKQIAEDYLSEKYCLAPTGESIWIEIYYFGLPKTTLRIAGVERTDQITQVGIRLYYKGTKYDGRGESETEIRAMLLEVQEGSIPFEKMTVSSALKKAIGEAISKLP